jgi:hypothetical protein
VFHVEEKYSVGKTLLRNQNEAIETVAIDYCWSKKITGNGYHPIP